MGRKIALWLCQVPVLGSWSEYRRSLYSLVLRTCLSVEMWSMPLRKGQLLEASSGGREAFGWMGIFGYSSCWLISAVDREGLHRDKYSLALHRMEAGEQLQSVLTGGAH